MTLPVDDLLTVRDLVRYAVSRFNAARIDYGHGTANALDEAAFIVLEALKLPIDELAPWLEARLTRPEREIVLGLIEARITTRKPAPYLLGRAYVGGLAFKVDERAIIPRSYLAELMLAGTLGADGLGLIDPDRVTRILDLCTGGGSLAIIASRLFPDAHVDAVDLSKDALALAAENVAEHEVGEAVSLIHGDLYAPVKGRRYDLIIANPPYVAEDEVAAFPPEHRAEPAMAHLGGPDGLDLVRRIIDGAGAHLTPGGGLLCEIGTGRDILEEGYPDTPFVWLDTEASEGEVFWLERLK
jgi:ribosomal protein L3 glutamine methyltransferase